MTSVLLIDDDRDDAESFKEALIEVNPSIHFHHFDNADDALKKLADQSTSLPDVIFLDINMPIISGWECLTHFRKTTHLSNIPVVMYTTSSLEMEKQIAQDLGATDFITKPNEYKLLKEMLSKTLRLRA